MATATWPGLSFAKNKGNAGCGQSKTLINARRIKKFLLIVCTVLLCFKTYAQDPVYTQAFLSPIYLNPAATGTGDEDLRVSAIARRQWWSVPSDMYFSSFSVDKYVSAIHSGVGLIATNSSEGYLNKNAFYGTYSFHIFPGSGDKNCDPPKWFFTGGLQFGFGQTRVNYKNLVFGDQINIYGYIPGSESSANPPINSGRYYPDFAAGLFFNYNFDEFNRILVGVANHHINRPDESLVFTSDSIRSVLPMLWTPSVMYTYSDPNAPWSYSLEGIFYKQGYDQSFQVGAEVTQNQVNISLGLWYRGSSNFQGINEFCVSLAINLFGKSENGNKVKIGVDQDAEIGNKAYSYTTGSSELGLVWDINTYRQEADSPCKPVISSTKCPATP